MDFDLYAEILKKTDTASNYDKKIFEEYHRKKISLRECFEWFMKNNLGRVEESYWDPNLFKSWLRTIGY